MSEAELFRIQLTPELQHCLSQQDVEDNQEPVEDSPADGNMNEEGEYEVMVPTGAMAGGKLQVMIGSIACQVAVPDGVSEGDLFRVKLTPEVQHLLSQSDVEDTQESEYQQRAIK
mgnify:CR=1 FL=1